MTDKESMAMALDALETLMIERGSIYEKAIVALKERLAQPEQKPRAWLVEFENGDEELHFDEQSVGEIHMPLYTHPPQRTEPVACERCKQLEEQAYDLLGKLQAANLSVSMFKLSAEFKEKST